MKKNSVLFLCMLTTSYVAFAQQKGKIKQAVDYVNPLIGTPYAGFKQGLDGGGTVPAVGTPYAMTNFLAQTAEPKMGLNAYVYEEKSIMGFLASHQPTVWMGDYGYVSVMPQIGELKLLPKERALPFEHSDEVSHPYYYSVLLNAGNNQKIKGEIAAASRAAIFQFTFPASEQARFIIQGIDLNPELADPSNDYGPRMKSIKGYVKIDTVKNEITGYNPDRMSAQIGPDMPNFKGYFVIQCNKKIASFGTWDNATVSPSSVEQLGTRMGAYINFKTKANEKIELRIGTSFISLEQARINMAKEIAGRNFAQLVTATRNTWQKNLECMQPEGISEDQKSIFYTALFHTMQFPREMSEYGKYYSGFDDQIHTGSSYTDYSLWDTYRALHPLLIFSQPDRVNGMITAMLQMYREGGRLPMWPNPAETNIMISTHADAVIADAYVKGLRGYDTKLAYEALLKDAMVPPENDTSLAYGDRDLWTGYEARAGLTAFNSIGYVPFGKTAESVSRTIEYSSDNYSVAQMAKAMGKASDYNKILAWSKNYKKLYDSTTGFLIPKLADGTFVQFNPKNKLGRQDGFTEGDQWTYLFGAMQDIPGMIDMMGGREKFIAKLDENFNGNHYRHDNEPGHHYSYLYDYCGEPWKTQELIRKHTTENYRNEPLGINGNEDCGQMAAWYIFGVMGFYPVTPASGIYAIGAPQFPKLVLKYKASNQPKKFTIIANKLSAENKYIQSVQLDGKSIDHPFIMHTSIINGHQLVFEMGPLPNKNWK
ncbi:MAG: glycosyl hydrolase family 92 [Ferruginibacter sp.]|uniref:GH92 family glycosyl hydrolase n=1 Tax=Ferruginibacter sp. TaxID=1940288 RepID=UPI00265B1C0E|nr:GH92 family glycosyl hydrolase [Ferruginibacter sp.]MDB5275853.1 glycosyl hydrolase family 92 [Ferruginibacter sp.]